MTDAVDRDTWKQLIRPALRIIDSLPDAGYGELDFRLGGGTVLMLRFDHRFSKDIDIFTYDAQALGFISPRLNDTAASETQHYQEQANALKLLLPQGDIDFIVAAPVIPDAPCEPLDIDGRTVKLEATAEILAKKLAYRAESLKARDAFDLAAALRLDRDSALQALRATVHTRPALLTRLNAMAIAPAEDLAKDLLITPSGRSHLPGMVETLLQAVAEVDGTPAPSQAHG